MDWGVPPERGQPGQDAAMAGGGLTFHHPPSWGLSFPNVGSHCYDVAAPAAPLNYAAPHESVAFNSSNRHHHHHHHDTTSSSFSTPDEDAAAGIPRDGYFPPCLGPPMRGGHVAWTQAATNISERSLFPIQHQLHSPRDHDGSGGGIGTPAPASASTVVAAHFSPPSSASAVSPSHSPTLTAGQCSAVSWTSSPPPPEDYTANVLATMAKPVLRTDATAGTTKVTPKGTGKKRGAAAVAKPVVKNTRVAKPPPKKKASKEPAEEDGDDDDGDDGGAGDYEASSATNAAALTPNHFPTLEAYKTHMRLWHNRIGRKYRNKLNDQFENLLAVLQLEEAGSRSSHGGSSNSNSLDGVVIQGSKKHTTTTGRGRAINKAKLLDMARQRIEDMMEERSAWRVEREDLHGRLQAVGAWNQ